MQQIVNITDVRNNLSSLISDVSKDKKTIVIVRDSIPEAVLVSYRNYLNNEAERENQWKLEFENLLKEGKKSFRKWAKKKNIDLDKLSEEEIYDLIDKA